MTKIIYFDCFSGISGDMALGALLDAGLPLDALRAELAKLHVDGWTVDAEHTMRGYLSGTRAHVYAPEQHVHRHLSDVRAIIEGSALAPQVKADSIAVFTLLAEAEGKVHGVSAEAVHFHEVGALDAIVDIVGVVAGLALLGVEQCYASPLPLGSGWVRAAHGLIPVPAPATLNMLAAVNAPISADTTPFELVTPTGAALLAHLATFERPAMQLERIGYGFGKRELERPNALRVWLGAATTDHRPPTTGQRPTAIHETHPHDHTHDQHHASRITHQPDQHTHDQPFASRIPYPVSHVAPQAELQPHESSITNHAAHVVLLETNIDNQPAEQLSYAVERLFELGALDVWQTPIQMKKGRAATLLSALLPAALETAAVALVFRETTTLGVRRRAVERHICERALVAVDTPLGAVQIKVKHWHGEQLGVAPEYEDCARLARAHNLALADVYQLAAEAFKSTH